MTKEEKVKKLEDEYRQIELRQAEIHTEIMYTKLEIENLDDLKGRIYEINRLNRKILIGGVEKRSVGYSGFKLRENGNMGGEQIILNKYDSIKLIK